MKTRWRNLFAHQPSLIIFLFLHTIGPEQINIIFLAKLRDLEANNKIIKHDPIKIIIFNVAPSNTHWELKALLLEWKCVLLIFSSPLHFYLLSVRINFMMIFRCWNCNCDSLLKLSWRMDADVIETIWFCFY